MPRSHSDINRLHICPARVRIQDRRDTSRTEVADGSAGAPQHKPIHAEAGASEARSPSHYVRRGGLIIMKREVFLKYRTLGRTGLNVSEISLGTVELGLDYGIPVEGEVRRPPEEAAARLLHQALDRGINMIDTARAYGESESIIGRALEGRRREYVLATKVQTFHEMKLSHSDLAARMTASVEQSLQALRTDFVDVLMLHSAPTTAFGDGPFEEILLRLKSRGWCRYLGA